MSKVENQDSEDSIPTTLQRGKACLRCRRRKMRCDGVKPACQQCCRAKKPDECVYDDGKGKTRTQILRETVAQLEQRVRELESPDYPSSLDPGSAIYIDHRRWSGLTSESSSSSVSGSVGSGIGLSHSPFATDDVPPESPAESWMGIPSPSPPPFPENMFQNEGISEMLLDIFAPHRYQCALSAHFARIRDATRMGVQERHPALMNSIYLWSCFVSRPGPLCAHESQYLAAALNGLGDGLSDPNRVLDIIQASCLLALYFLVNGRMLEGGYHISTAAAMCVQWGLHGGVSNPPVLGLTSSEGFPIFKLPPPKDSVEAGERILTFWQTYVIDRCWSVVLHRPANIIDGQTASLSINAPWPLDMDEYENGHFNDAATYQTIQTFFEGQASNLAGGFSALALRVKASALWEKAHMLSSTWDHRLTPSNVFTDDFQNLENTIKRFIPTLLSTQEFNVTREEVKHAHIVNHTLAHAAMIQLYYSFGHEDAASYEKCLRAARSCIDIINHVNEVDYGFLDPAIGPCWSCVSDVLVRELDHIETAWPLVNTAEIRNEIQVNLYAMNKVSVRCPLVLPAVIKLQKRLGEISPPHTHI